MGILGDAIAEGGGNVGGREAAAPRWPCTSCTAAYCGSAAAQGRAAAEQKKERNKRTQKSYEIVSQPSPIVAKNGRYPQRKHTLAFPTNHHCRLCADDDSRDGGKHHNIAQGSGDHHADKKDLSGTALAQWPMGSDAELAESRRCERKGSRGKGVRPGSERGRPAFAVARPGAHVRRSAPAQCHGVLRQGLIELSCRRASMPRRCAGAHNPVMTLYTNMNVGAQAAAPLIRAGAAREEMQ